MLDTEFDFELSQIVYPTIFKNTIPLIHSCVEKSHFLEIQRGFVGGTLYLN